MAEQSSVECNRIGCVIGYDKVEWLNNPYNYTTTFFVLGWLKNPVNNPVV